MAELEYFFVAESLSIDQTNNRVSAFSIIEELFPRQLPAVLPKCVAASTWIMSDEDEGRDFQVAISIDPGPSGTPIELRANFTSNGRIQRIFNRLVGLPVFQEGEMRISVSLNGVHAATHRVLVHAPNEEAITDGTLIYGELVAQEEADGPTT